MDSFDYNRQELLDTVRFLSKMLNSSSEVDFSYNSNNNNTDQLFFPQPQQDQIIYNKQDEDEIEIYNYYCTGDQPSPSSSTSNDFDDIFFNDEELERSIESLFPQMEQEEQNLPSAQDYHNEPPPPLLPPLITCKPPPASSTSSEDDEVGFRRLPRPANCNQKPVQKKSNVPKCSTGTPKQKRRRRSNLMKPGSQLYQFILQLLDDEDKRHLIRWEKPYEQGIFRILNKDEVAKMWGQARNHKDMSYDSLSRGLRHYYSQGLLNAVNKKLHYQFTERALSEWKVIRDKDSIEEFR